MGFEITLDDLTPDELEFYAAYLQHYNEVQEEIDKIREINRKSKEKFDQMPRNYIG